LYVSDGDLKLLNVNRDNDGRWLNSYYDNPDNRWNRENGFAFSVALLSLFLPDSFCRGVFFCQIVVPATKHLASFV
jgi:hypothetical protein